MNADLNCKVCGNSFRVVGARRIASAAFCSIPCANTAKRMSQVEVQCRICGKRELVNKARALVYGTCSKTCMGKDAQRRALSGKVALTCEYCGKVYYKKRCRAEKSTYCSNACRSQHFGFRYLGSSNPNYRSGRDEDGYLTAYSPENGYTTKVHLIVACAVLGISGLPSGFSIHHRDTDKTNNDPKNLALLSHSDHKWLHHHVPNETLHAVAHGLVSIDDATRSLSGDDQTRAKTLLPLNILMQREPLLGSTNPKKEGIRTADSEQTTSIVQEAQK